MASRSPKSRPTAKGLTEQKNFWVEMKPNSFIPGFADQLIGAKAGDKRTVTVDFPADFVTPQLAGKKGIYEVEVVEVKEKVLPALDDALAKAYGAENLEKLREGVRRDLENELKFKQDKNVRTRAACARCWAASILTCRRPRSRRRRATWSMTSCRKTPSAASRASMIEQQKEQIYSAATSDAKERVKLPFLMQKIAEKEEIKVSQDEISNRIAQLAGDVSDPAGQVRQGSAEAQRPDRNL